MAQKLDYEQVKEYVQKYGNGTTLLSDHYEKAYGELSFRCRCGNEFISSFGKFKHRNKKQCNKCGKEQVAKEYRFSIAEIQEFVKENSECELLSKSYKNTKENLEFRCSCGKDFETSFEKFKFRHKRQCEQCGIKIRASKLRKSHDDFEKQVKESSNNKYEVLTKYNRDNVHVTMKHLECGHEYKVTPSNFLNGKRCPKCSSSKGEIEIIDFLENNHFQFEREYKISECKYIRPLPFDFAVFNDDILVCLIEFDGEQHNIAKDFFGGEKGLRKRKMYDEIKNNYCSKHKIVLIRVPYHELGNIDEFLTNEFTKNNFIYQLSIL